MGRPEEAGVVECLVVGQPTRVDCDHFAGEEVIAGHLHNAVSGNICEVVVWE